MAKFTTAIAALTLKEIAIYGSQSRMLLSRVRSKYVSDLNEQNHVLDSRIIYLRLYATARWLSRAYKSRYTYAHLLRIKRKIVCEIVFKGKYIRFGHTQPYIPTRLSHIIENSSSIARCKILALNNNICVWQRAHRYTYKLVTT